MRAVEGWKTCRLGDLVVVQGGFAFKSNDFDDGGIPIIRMSDLDDGHLDLTGSVRIKSNQLKALSKFALHTGDFLVGMSGSIGNYAIVRIQDLPAYLNQRVGRFLLSDESSADYDFLTQIARSNLYKLHVEMLAAGAAQVNISPSQIESFSFDLPPKPEQTKIAEILSTVDRAIEQTEALIAKQQRIKTGLMQDLLTRGIDGHGNLRSEQTHQFKGSPLGRIPVEWEVGEGIRFFTLRSGYSVTVTQNTNQGEFLYLKVDDFNALENSNGLMSSANTFDCPPHLAHRLLPKKTIVFPKRGAAIFVNRVEILQSSGTLDPNLMGMQTKDGVIPEYMRFMLLRRNLGTICDNSGIPQINNKHLYPLIFCMPGIPEQERIVARAKQLEITIFCYAKNLNKLRSLKTALMQNLLTGKKRVTALLKETTKL